MMQAHQLLHAAIVADHGALEAPLAPQNIVQQPAIGMRRHAVNLIVGGHHRADIGQAHDFLEGRKEILAQCPHRNARRSDIGAALRLAVTREVLQSGKYLAVRQRQRVALQAAHGGHPELRHQVGIFAEGLLDAAPARIPRHVHHGRQRLAHAARANLAPDDDVDPANELGIPAAGKTNGLRKQRGIDGRITMQPFLVEPYRHA